MADVTIRGAGVFGLSIAFVCARRGAKVRVIDPGGVGAGASGGIVGALAPHVPENWNTKKDFQLRSLLAASDFWADVDRIGGGSSGYMRSGRLQPIADEAALTLARGRATSAASLWEGQATWTVVPATAAPWEPQSPSGYLIHDTLSALINPRRAVAALAAAVAALGGEIVQDGEDTGRVVEATGWQGLQALTAVRGRMVGTGVKGQAALLKCDQAHAPQVFAGGVHVIPHLDGTVAVGSTTEREFDDPAATDDKLDAVIAAARDAVPALADAPVIARWAGVRPSARTRAPMLGPHPYQQGRFVANGGFKIGFGMANGVADVMADLVLDGVDRIPEGFRVSDNL